MLVAVFGIVFGVTAGIVSTVYAGRIVPNTTVGSVAVGALTTEQAALRIQERLDSLSREGIPVRIGEHTEILQPESIGLDVNIQEAIDDAYRRGHEGSWYRQAAERVASLWQERNIETPAALDASLLHDRIAEFE